MNLMGRAKNLWRLSGMVETEFVPLFDKTHEVLDRLEKELETPQGRFIPFIKADPIKDLIEEQP